MGVLTPVVTILLILLPAPMALSMFSFMLGDAVPNCWEFEVDDSVRVLLGVGGPGGAADDAVDNAEDAEADVVRPTVLSTIDFEGGSIFL